MYVCLDIYVYIYIYIHIFIERERDITYTYTCIYIYIYIYTHPSPFRTPACNAGHTCSGTRRRACRQQTTNTNAYNKHTSNQAK